MGHNVLGRQMLCAGRMGEIYRCVPIFDDIASSKFQVFQQLKNTSFSVQQIIYCFAIHPT